MIINTANAVMFFLVVTFTDTGTTATYQMQSLAQCESAKAPVKQLYTDLKTPVKLECKTSQRKSVNL